MVAWGRRTAFYAGLILIWQLAAQSGLWGQLPSPGAAGRFILEGFLSGEYLAAAGASLLRMALGFGLATLAGVALGLFNSRFAWADETLGSFAVAFQALPSICWFPLVALWLGPSEKAILFVTVTGGLFTIATGVAAGVKAIPPLLIRAAENMGARGLWLALRVMLPAALPAVLGGLRQGWAFAWRSLMAGELLSVTPGLGRLLAEGQKQNDAVRLTAVVLLILAVGLLVDRALFAPVERLIRHRWGLAHSA